MRGCPLTPYQWRFLITVVRNAATHRAAANTVIFVKVTVYGTRRDTPHSSNTVIMLGQSSWSHFMIR